MNLILKIVNNPKETIVASSYEFKKEGGTIGRGTDCSWVLADKRKEVSSLHAEIIYRAGSYYFFDSSTNGTLYKRDNRRVPPQEMVKLNESEVLCIGAYEILVGYVKSNDKNSAVNSFLNRREIDIAVEEKLLLKEQGNSPLDLILKEKVEEKDILEFANIAPQEEHFIGDDAFDDVVVADAYTTHITAPTFEEEKPKETIKIGEEEDILLTLFASKLGINLRSMSREKQIEIVSDLAEGILTAIDGVERLEKNSETIAQKLEKPNYKVDVSKTKNAKEVLKGLIYGGNTQTVVQKLKSGFERATQHHTALYEASREQNEELQREFSPNQLNEKFGQQGIFALMPCQDAKVWKLYQTEYQHLNESSTSSKSFSKILFNKYKEVLTLLKLAKSE